MRRLVATSIDGLAWLGLSFGSFLGCAYLTYNRDKANWASIAFHLSSLVMPCYFLTEAFGYRRVGKRLAGVMIVSQDGSTPTTRAGLLRWVVKSSPWFMAFVLGCLSKHIPDSALYSTILDGYPNLVGGFILRVLERIMVACGLDFEIREFLLYAPVYAMSFVAEGMIVLTVLIVGEVLILFPARRTLVDQLSRTVVVRQAKRAPRGFEPLSVVRQPSDLALRAAMPG